MQVIMDSLDMSERQCPVSRGKAAKLGKADVNMNCGDDQGSRDGCHV